MVTLVDPDPMSHGTSSLSMSSNLLIFSPTPLGLSLCLRELTVSQAVLSKRSCYVSDLSPKHDDWEEKLSQLAPVVHLTPAKRNLN